jgi:transposase-like protein
MKKWRRHTLEFKRQVVERMKTCENIEALAKELKIERKLLYTWKYQFEGRPEPRHANYGLTAEERKEKQLQNEVARLQAALGKKELENDFLKRALLGLEKVRQPNNGPGASASTTPSESGCQSKAV